MSVVIYRHPGAPWGVCLKSLYYCSGSTLVVVLVVHTCMHLLRVWNHLCVFDILRYSQKWNFGRDFVVIHTSTSAGQKGLVHRQSYILRISQCVELHDQDVFTNQSKWIVPCAMEITRIWQWNQNLNIHDVYNRDTNVLSNWAAFNKHHASTEVDLTYVDSSVKPWECHSGVEVAGWTVDQIIYLGLIPGIPSMRVGPLMAMMQKTSLDILLPVSR